MSVGNWNVVAWALYSVLRSGDVNTMTSAKMIINKSTTKYCCTECIHDQFVLSQLLVSVKC